MEKITKMKELHSNLIKIARFLSDGDYHSGDELGKSLAITRSAVWKSIKKLQQYGIQIDSVKSKGYALTEPLLLLDKLRIKKQLKLTSNSSPISRFLPACPQLTIIYNNIQNLSKKLKFVWPKPKPKDAAGSTAHGIHPSVKIFIFLAERFFKKNSANWQA